jgi:alkylation response protein AidB-like acyl-CoA dehydrogenase
MDVSLTDDQREIQALTRESAAAEIEPYAAESDREHRFPHELLLKLADLACRIGAFGVADDKRAARADTCRRAARSLPADARARPE